MEKKIENWLKRKGIEPQQRILREGGGQYIENFTKEFADFIREETLIEVQSLIKNARKI